MGVRIERDEDADHVVHLHLDFGKLNLLDPAAIDDLADAVDDAPGEASVVTIRGVADESGGLGGLTGGLDLAAVRDYDATEARELIGRLHGAMQRVRDLRAVTVCGCGEYALGAGLELAMSCDFRVATEDAALGLPEIDVGLVTGIQGGLLVRLVGLQAAKELVYTGEPISGTKAEALGLVNRAETERAYEPAFDGLVDTLAAKPPRILRWQTDVFRALRSAGVERGIDSTGETIAMCFGTPEQRAAMESFLDDAA